MRCFSHGTFADELVQKLSEKGFHGDFIVPLPVPRIVRQASGR